MGLIMAIMIHALEVWNFQGEWGNRKSSSSHPVEPEFRFTGNFRKPESHLLPESYIRASATISSQDCSHPRSSVKNHTSQYPVRPTGKH